MAFLNLFSEQALEFSKNQEAKCKEFTDAAFERQSCHEQISSILSECSMDELRFITVCNVLIITI
jgi:hypothetical protein